MSMIIIAESALARGIPAALLALLAACGNQEQAPRVDAAGDDFDRGAMLASLSERVLLPVQEDVATRTGALDQAVGAYCAALGTDGEGTARDGAQRAWREAMGAWQVAEAMLIGPAAMDSRALRDAIYSWPLVNSCAVDQAVMQKLQDPAFDIAAQLVNRRGLDALEYLLFVPTLAVSCPPQSVPAGWDALSDAERQAARCALAADAAADVAASAQTLLAAWSPAGGNYAGALASAGQPGSSLPSAQEAVNMVSDALFYVDAAVKDLKLAEPAGITLNICGAVQAPCIDELESRWAAHSRDNLLANLRGLRMVFTGDGPESTDGIGFDDFLIARDAGELATSMLAQLDAAIAAVEAIPAPMTDALQDAAGYQAVVAAHTAVKAFTDVLKSQFLTVLGLDLPDSAAADND